MKRIADAIATRALAAALAAAACATAFADGHEAAKCRYVRVGTAPLEWRGSQPFVQGSVKGLPLSMELDTAGLGNRISPALAEKLELVQTAAMWSDDGDGTSSTQDYIGHLPEFDIGTARWLRTTALVTHTADRSGMFVGPNALFDFDFEMNDKAIVFFRPENCARDASLAYWSPGAPFAGLEQGDDKDRRVYVKAELNHHSATALVSSADAATLVNLEFARGLGIDPVALGLPSRTAWVGGHKRTMWIGRFDEFALDEEVVRNAHVAIVDLHGAVRAANFVEERGRFRAPDLILGGDFLKAHRVLFATSQRRMYFTYLGGEIFNTPTTADGADPESPGSASAPAPAASAAPAR